MLKYKQIWHGIKPIRWLNKFNLTETSYITMEITSPTHSYDEIVMPVRDVQEKLCF